MARQCLSALVDSSLVRPLARGGEPRFALLETIREYALERLADSGDWAPAHAAFEEAQAWGRSAEINRAVEYALQQADR